MRSSPRLAEFDQDDIGRRRTAVGLDRGGDAAHLNLEMGLAEPPVLTGGLDGGGGLDRLAKGLHRRRAAPAQYAR